LDTGSSIAQDVVGLSVFERPTSKIFEVYIWHLSLKNCFMERKIKF